MPRALLNKSVDELGRRTTPPVHTVEYAIEAEKKLDIERTKRLKKSGSKGKGVISTSDLVDSFEADDGFETILTMNVDSEQQAERINNTHAELDDFFNTHAIESKPADKPEIVQAISPFEFDELDQLLKETKGDTSG